MHGTSMPQFTNSSRANLDENAATPVRLPLRQTWGRCGQGQQDNSIRMHHQPDTLRCMAPRQQAQPAVHRTRPSPAAHGSIPHLPLQQLRCPPAALAAAGAATTALEGLMAGADAAAATAAAGGFQSEGTAHSSGLKSGPPKAGGSGEAEAAGAAAGVAAVTEKGAGMGTVAPPGKAMVGPVAAGAARDAESVRSIEAACTGRGAGRGSRRRVGSRAWRGCSMRVLCSHQAAPHTGALAGLYARAQASKTPHPRAAAGSSGLDFCQGIQSSGGRSTVRQLDLPGTMRRVSRRG